MLKLRKFLNNTPPEFIRRFLEHVSGGHWNDIDWQETRPRIRTNAIQAAIEAADDPALTEILATVDLIEQLADEAGRRALRNVHPKDEDLTRFDALPDPRACAVEVLVRSSDLFDNALSTHFAERLRSGRYWSAYHVVEVPTGPPAKDTGSRKAFRKSVGQIMAGVVGPGRVDIEWFERVVDDPETRERRTCCQATLYHEDTPRSEPAFGEAGAIDHRPARPVIEGAVIYDEEDQSISIVAKGGGKTREQIANAFLEDILQIDAELQLMTPWRLDFSPLIQRPHFEVRSEDGIECVEWSAPVEVVHL